MWRWRRRTLTLVAMLDGVRTDDGCAVAVVCVACGELVVNREHYIDRIAVFSPDDSIVVWGDYANDDTVTVHRCSGLARQIADPASPCVRIMRQDDIDEMMMSVAGL